MIAAYLLVTAMALALPHRPAGWPVLLVVHLAAAAILLRPQAVSGVLPARMEEVVADWYALLSIPALYAELALLNVAVWNGTYFDSIVQHWEMAVFGGQPSRELALRFPVLWLSEPLHASYLTFYVIIYGPALILYLRGRRADQRRAVFALMATFLVHYLCFIVFPVQGPRYLFPPPGGAVADGRVYALAHRVLESGSSRGTAFPSSHVGVAVAQTLTAFRFLPRVAPVFAVLTVGLACGAVYGGFHYAIDAVAGAVLGAAVWLSAPRLARILGD